jgi:hypothetical protein
MNKITGYYAKLKTGTTLHQFVWGANDELSLIADNGDKTWVNANDYDIVQINQIVAN